jgi:hypothetical protein
MTPRRDTKLSHKNARSQSLCCGLTIDEKRPNGLDVLAAIGLRLLRFLTGWAKTAADDRHANAQPLSCTLSMKEGGVRTPFISASTY